MGTDLKGWIDIGCDVNWSDYGGRWAKKLRPGAYLVLRFENMEDHCGSQAVENGEIERYECDVLCVDLVAVGESGALTKALESCGWSIQRRAKFADCATDADGPTMPGIVNDYDGEVIADAQRHLGRGRGHAARDRRLRLLLR